MSKNKPGGTEEPRQDPLKLTLEDWILALIAYAGGRIRGKTRIHKGLFLVWQEVGGVRADFVPYKYGPYSREVDESLNHLVKSGLVRERVVPGGDETPANEYELTDKGWERAKKVLKHLEEASVLEKAKPFLDLATKGSLVALIGFVYTMYPEWAASSEIKSKIRNLGILRKLRRY